MKQFLKTLLITLFLSSLAFAQRGPSNQNMVVTAGMLNVPHSVPGLERRAFHLINNTRQDEGLPALEWSDRLAKLARSHSQQMAELKFFSHLDIAGQTVTDRAGKFGIQAWRAIGENIAYSHGYQDPAESALEGWMKSRMHKQNLLNKDWSESAIGIAVSAEGSYYFTHVFLLKK